MAPFAASASTMFERSLRRILASYFDYYLKSRTQNPTGDTYVDSEEYLRNLNCQNLGKWRLAIGVSLAQPGLGILQCMQDQLDPAGNA